MLWWQFLPLEPGTTRILGSAGNGPPTSRKALWSQGALVPRASAQPPWCCGRHSSVSVPCSRSGILCVSLHDTKIQPSSHTLIRTHQPPATGRTACCREICSPKRRRHLEGGRNSCLSPFAQLYILIEKVSKFINKYIGILKCSVSSYEKYTNKFYTLCN